MAERTVVWKAVGDFSSIARQSAMARRELSQLENKHRQYSKNQQDFSAKQLENNNKLTQSNRQWAASINRVTESLRKQTQAQRDASDSGRRLSTTTTNMGQELRKTEKDLFRFSRAQQGLRSDLDKTDTSLAKVTKRFDDFGKTNGQFDNLIRNITTVRREVGELSRQASNSTASVIASNSSLVESNKRVADSGNEVNRSLTDQVGASKDAASAHRDLSASTTGFKHSTDSATESVSRHEKEIHKTRTAHRSFRTDLDGSALAISKLKAAFADLQNVGVAGVFSRLANSLGNLDAQARRNTSSFSIMNSAAVNFKGEGMLQVFQNMITKMGVFGGMALGVVDALGSMAGAIASLSTGLIGMVGALSPAIGILGTLPGFAIAIAGAFGTTMTSLSGVGAAMKAYAQEQKSASKNAASDAKQMATNQRQMANAERSLANARRTSARQIRDAERGVRDARERSAQVAQSSARSIQRAEDTLIRSKRQVVDAEKNVLKAQRDVNNARADAIRQLKDMRDAVKDYALQEEGASIALEEARLRLSETMNDPAATSLEKRSANLAVREAEARLADVREASAENDKKLAEANRKGVEGSDLVVNALERENDAQQSLLDAKKGAIDAEADLAITKADAARQVRDANEAITRAEQGLIDAQETAAESTARAAEALKAASTEASQGSARINQFNEAMAKLSPQARAVVHQLISMKDQWAEVRKASDAAVLPGVLSFLQSLELLFPTITKFAGSAGKVMGDFFQQLGKMMTTNSAITGWNTVLEDGVQIMDNFRKATLNIAEVIGAVAIAAANSGLNDWLGKITVGWTEAWKAWTSGEEGQKNLIGFFEKTMKAAELFGSIVGGLVGVLFNVGVAGQDAGNKILTAFDESLKKFNEWAKTPEGMKSIKELADASVPVYKELGNLIIAIAKGMGELGKTSSAGEFIKQLRTELGPVIMMLFRELQKTDILSRFITMIARLGKTFVESGLMEDMADLAIAIFEMAEQALPALMPVIKQVISTLTLFSKALTQVFGVMAEGGVVGKILQGFTLALLGLSTIGAFAILIRKVKNFVKSYVNGFRDVLDVTDKAVRRIEGAADRISRAFRKMNQPQRSAGFMDPTGASPKRSADSVDVPVDVTPRRSFRKVTVITPTDLVDAKKDGEKLGDATGDGIVEGLKDSKRKVNNAAEDLAEEVVDGAEDGLDINSPSRRGIRIGRNFGDAIADGARSQRRAARRAGDDLGDSLADGAEDTVKRRSGGFKSVVKNVFAVGAVAVAAIGTGLANIGVSSVESFGRLTDILEKSRQLFGENSVAMEQWGANAINTMGLSKQSALDLATNFGQLFQAMGYSREESARLSQEFTLLAAGLAAANPDTTTLDAYAALEAAFQGDYTELSKLNPAINESAALQEALRISGKKSTDELTEQEKRAGLLAIAHGQAGKATDDLARKQENAAGKVEKTKEKWQNFKDKLGEKLDTKIAPVIDELGKLLDDEQKVNDFADALTGLAQALVDTTTALGQALNAAQGKSTIKVAGVEMGGSTNVDEEVMRRAGVGRKLFSSEANVSAKDRDRLYDEARASLIARGEDVSEHDRRERNILDKKQPWTQKERERVEARRGLYNSQVRDTTQPPPTRQQPAGAGRGAAPGSPGQARQQGIPTKEEAYTQGSEIGKETGRGFNDGIGSLLAALNPFTAFIGLVKRLFGIQSPSTLFAGFGRDVVQGFINGITGFVGSLSTTITTWFTNNLINPVKNFLGIQSPSTLFAGFGMDTIQGFINGLLAKASEAKTTITTWFNDNIITPVKTFLGIQSPSTLFSSFGIDTIQGFINGVLAKAAEAKNFVTSWFNDNIVTPVKTFLGIQSPSTVFSGIGVDVIQGLINGIDSFWGRALTTVINFFSRLVQSVKDLLGIRSPSTVFSSIGTDVIQGFLDGVNSLYGRTMTRMQEFVDNVGRIWDGIREKTRGPVAFVVDTVYNKGIVPMWNAVAGLVDLRQLSTITFANGGQVGGRPMTGGGRPTQYASGGWTGPGERLKPAGFVHADEFVVKKSSRRKFERENPGLLDRINRTGSLYGGYYEGGRVTEDTPSHASASSFLGGTNPLPGGIEMADVLAFFLGGNVPVPGGRVTNLHGANGAYYGARWAGDLAMPGGTPVFSWKPGVVASTARWGHSYGWHIRINHPDGTNTLYAHLSNIGVSAGQQVAAGQTIGRVGTTGNSTGNHLHFEVRGGSQPLGSATPADGPGGVMAAMTAFGDMAKLITDPLGSMKEKFGTSPWVEALTKMPKSLADKAKSVMDEKLSKITDYIMSGGQAGADWQANANLLMAAGRAMGLSRAAMKIALITAAQESSMGTNRNAMYRVNGDGDVGWFQQRTTRGDGSVAQLADPAYALRVFINGIRVPAGYHVPGLYNTNWQSKPMWQAAADVQRPYAPYRILYNNWMDEAERWLTTFGYSSGGLVGYDRGGWTGPGHKYKPAGIVHADEFVVKKSSRRKFEAENPGALDHINRTGRLPGYHSGGIVKTGPSDGPWWRKGTTHKTNKWIGALRHFLGLDNWWAGWDDDFERALRTYSGGPAAHVWTQWRPIIDAMNRLPLDQFSDVGTVANKIGVPQDNIFRMWDTNPGAFVRDINDRRKIERMQSSYDWFRGFHKESVEELQSAMGVPVTGFWTEDMRKLLVHISRHVSGIPHADSMPTADGWSTVGAWGSAFDEVHNTIQINREWDKMMDQFYEWGYDSLIRHLNQVGTADGMQLARDLYNVPQNARDADIWYREFYEREDAIKDENSELNRLRRLVLHLRRYDNVGLQGLATELQLTMDTTAMLYRKAEGKGMLQGISQSKTGRINKDIIDFDKLFRFAMGGLVPGEGNLDSVFALLTPGEYVLTKDQTKKLFKAQNMMAGYQAPGMKGVAGAGIVGASGVGVVHNNVSNEFNVRMETPNPRLSGVALQKRMKEIGDRGIFGVDDE